jgi:hypothetical protein
MSESLGKHAMAAATVVALGGLSAVAVQAPAHAADFSAAYTCDVPMLGRKTATINGTLIASPNPATVNRKTHFRLQIPNLSLHSPVTIKSWSATAGIGVSGAETAWFQLTGSGGSVLFRQPITGDLTGDWTPMARGIDRFRGGNVTIRLNVLFLGTHTVSCVPKGPRPVAETLRVNSRA